MVLDGTCLTKAFAAQMGFMTAHLRAVSLNRHASMATDIAAIQEMKNMVEKVRSLCGAQLLCCTVNVLTSHVLSPYMWQWRSPPITTHVLLWSCSTYLQDQALTPGVLFNLLSTSLSVCLALRQLSSRACTSCFKQLEGSDRCHSCAASLHRLNCSRCYAALTCRALCPQCAHEKYQMKK